jgi:cytochrome c oxidase subunit 1
VLFLVNMVWSWRRGRIAEENPWSATTMEWMPGEFWVGASDDGPGGMDCASNGKKQAFRGPCDYAQNEAGIEFVPQWVEFEKAE